MKMPVAIALMTICLIAGFAVGFKFALFQRLQEDDRSVLNKIMASENRIVATLERNDITAFANSLPDDVIDIEDDGIHDKSNWLEIIQKQKDGGYVFGQITFENPRLLRVSPDAAIMFASERWSALDKGKPAATHVYTSALYVRRSGVWVPRLYQDSDAVN